MNIVVPIKPAVMTVIENEYNLSQLFENLDRIGVQPHDGHTGITTLIMLLQTLAQQKLSLSSDDMVDFMDNINGFYALSKMRTSEIQAEDNIAKIVTFLQQDQIDGTDKNKEIVTFIKAIKDHTDDDLIAAALILDNDANTDKAHHLGMLSIFSPIRNFFGNIIDFFKLKMAEHEVLNDRSPVDEDILSPTALVIDNPKPSKVVEQNTPAQKPQTAPEVTKDDVLELTDEVSALEEECVPPRMSLKEKLCKKYDIRMYKTSAYGSATGKVIPYAVLIHLIAQKKWNQSSELKKLAIFAGSFALIFGPIIVGASMNREANNARIAEASANYDDRDQETAAQTNARIRAETRASNAEIMSQFDAQNDRLEGARFSASPTNTNSFPASSNEIPSYRQPTPVFNDASLTETQVTYDDSAFQETFGSITSTDPARPTVAELNKLSNADIVLGIKPYSENSFLTMASSCENNAVCIDMVTKEMSDELERSLTAPTLAPRP